MSASVLEATCLSLGVSPDSSALPVVGEDLPAPLVDGTSVTYANFDYAASAPALATVASRLASVLPFYASVHRGAGYASKVSTQVYEEARTQVATFVGARADDVVVFTRNTTDSLNLLEHVVPAGGEVVFLDIEHHANLLPWQRRGHRCVPAAATLAETLQRLEAELAARPAALLSVTGSSNVTGEILPIADLVAIAHAHGARLAIDAAQLAPHEQIDLATSGIDYVVFSGHKIYAPFGAGVLVGRRDWLDAAPAYLAGGGAVVEVGVESTSWASAPHRHEAGSPNVLGAVALAQACQDVAANRELLAAHEATLTARLREGLSALPGVELLSIWPDSPARVGIVGFTVAGHDPGRLAAILSAEYGIGVRDGRFCAHPLLERLGVGTGAVRASVGAGSTLAQVERLIAAVAELIANGEKWTYEKVDGRWEPVADPRPLAAVVDGPYLPGAGSPCSR